MSYVRLGQAIETPPPVLQPGWVTSPTGGLAVPPIYVTAPQAPPSGLWEWARQNRTAVYAATVTLLALALLRGGRR